MKLTNKGIIARLMTLALFITLIGCTYGSCVSKTAGIVLDSGYSLEELKAVDSLKYAFSESYDIKNIDFDDLCDFNKIKDFDVILIPNGESLPLDAMAPVFQFASEGGDLVVLNAPMWKTQLIKSDGKYISRESYQNSLLERDPDFVFFDFSKDNLSAWGRGHSDKEGSAVSEIITDDSKKCLSVTLDNLQNFDTYGTTLDNSFHGGTILEIVAKGDANTGALVIECTEKDGSRWMGIIPLETSWKRFYLSPADFKYWPGSEGRGAKGDQLNTNNVARISVGMALSHIPTVGEGRHSYQIAQIGASKESSKYTALLTAAKPIDLDTLYPKYKVYNCSDVGELVTNKIQAITEQKTFNIPDAINSVSPRQQGNGLNKKREWRFINLIEAYSPSGEWRGTPASMKIHATGPLAGSVLVSFAIPDMDWYSQDLVKSVLRDTASAMAREVFFLDAGSDYFTYFQDQQIKVGANIINLSKTEKIVDLTCTVNCSPEKIITKTVTLPAKSVSSAIDVLDIKLTGEDKEYTVTCLMKDGKQIIDKTVNSINTWIPKAEKKFVTVKDGDFWLADQKFKPYGLNFMLSSGATNEGAYFGDYLSSMSYDPVVAERDIQKMKSLGFNAVSIFIFTGYIHDQNLLDMLRLLDKYGMKANLSLRPGTPMDFVADSAEQIINFYKLWDNDVVYAYDIAWEPSYGSYYNREWMDPAWELWVISQYGSIENAEKDWGYPIPRKDNGNVTNPRGAMIYNDGEHSKMVIAYKRFLDYYLYKNYNEARCRIRNIDSNHLVSFRMAETSNPNYKVEDLINYDFNYLVNAVDFLGPEAYGRFGNAERVKPARFVKEYARWANPDYPVVWPEAGYTVWDNTRMEVSEKKDKEVSQYYRLFYEALIGSGSNGGFFWFSCPGYRVDEKSDYGVYNEDFTDREITKIIREYGPKFLNAPDVKPNIYIDMPIDSSCVGVAGIYDKIGDTFWKLVDEGKNPGLKTEATGKTTDNVSLIALGDVLYNKSNPLKYVDGAFEYISINDVRVGSVPEITVPADKDVVIKAKVCNLNEAIWMSKSKNPVVLFAINKETGKKYITRITKDLKKGDTLDLEILIPRIPAGEYNFTLRFAISNKAQFGEKVNIAIVSK